MTNIAIETLDKETTAGIPYADTLVQRTSSHEAVVWRDGHGRDTIIDEQAHCLSAGFDVPQTHSAITTARSNEATIARVVERVDVLLMACEGRLDCSRRNVPHTDDLVFCTRGEVLRIRTEADTADVKIALFARTWILEHSNHLTRIDIVDLGCTIAAGGYEATIVAEANTAHDAAVNKVVDESHIKHSSHVRVVYSIPIWSLALELWRQLLWVELSKAVAHIWRGMVL